jgi:type IV secretion system protein VirB8
MFKKPKSDITPNDERSDLHWEADVVLNLRRSQLTAWRVAFGSLTLAGLLAIALILLIPLHKVVPYVVMVDKLTGEATIVSTAKDFVSASALNDKHWVKQFVISRERYNYRLLQHDYDNVKRMAGNSPWAAYDRLFQGDGAMDKRLGENMEITPIVLSTTLGEGGMATVRYELRTRDLRAGGEPAVARRVATMRYAYELKANVKESEAIDNPLGFTVTAYQTDPELSQGDGAAK